MPDQLSEGFRFADPCEEDVYLEHLRESDDGNLEPRTNCGRYTCRHIRLDRPDLLYWRRMRRQVAEDLSRFEAAKTRLARMPWRTADPADRSGIQDEIAAIESMILGSRERFGL
jgi:hypothetical protein